MTILSDRDLKRACDDHGIVAPLGPYAIQPASIDVRLGHSFARVPLALRGRTINPAHLPDDAMERWEADKVVIRPGEFLLATTMETVRLPANLCAQLEGRSSIARLGMQVHFTAGWIDPGFEGQVVFEIGVSCGAAPIELDAGYRIAQLVVMRMTSPAQRPYGHEALGSRYQGQTGAQPSRASW